MNKKQTTLLTEIRFEFSPMARIYHINNIEIIASGMEKQLELFAEKNGNSEMVKEKKEQLIALKEAQVFISKLFSELEKEKKKHLELKVKNAHAELLIDVLKNGIESWESKYTQLLHL